MPEVELTEEERKKQVEERKAMRVQRFNEFKNILNSFAMDDSSESESSESGS